MQISAGVLAPAALGFAINALAWSWLKQVSSHVPDPYLDEIFHIPQAQVYCQGNWHSWDPKITTPPGLYIVAWGFAQITGGCSTWGLRVLNVMAISMLAISVSSILRHIQQHTVSSSESEDAEETEPELDGQTYWMNAHSALNIALFPPLFFFSGLFYTDVMSALFVIWSYDTFVAFLWGQPGTMTILDALQSIFFGICALFFRQTNIFWVAVFPAGLAVVDALKWTGEATVKTDISSNTTAKTYIFGILRDSWDHGLMYDASISEAALSDYAIFLVSAAIVALKRPLVIIKAIFPYTILLGLFGGFVAWNGGVVLGDKSNHVATLNFPQMLYIWPYITFFSLPLIAMPLLRPLINTLPDSKVKSIYLEHIPGPPTKTYPRIISIVFFMALGFLAVYFNTVVHPFTLADNRHFVFYVFRILRRHPAIKYLAVPVYITCGWLVIQTLGSRKTDSEDIYKRQEKGKAICNRPCSQSCQISFIIVWLATTALSVVTAPLVEPRYFIIPWIIWRVHVPIPSALPSQQPGRKPAYDLRLLFETAWLLAINAIVGYNFLYRGFSWPSEPGKVQRFLW
ncbi:hypothetical protein GQ43DRAFT_311470 [Delitschia confertaspora ATCC 74209]|uniref:Dol-P-Glc:Glc(2)Man(9)GlcNAc(2)-PP-Dol alpha-1,2-glucosyltransferase n=1 Tax=Delitschia confertaspora ATCC 74209 TaxID=1513339 RepID=A0A9P4JQD1_9PLEO|nr:hypothetical protein GQ43DRAFT_311470 [Delitschia confertaspora ATCC 74209]